MNKIGDMPLVTISMMTYNQEKYVKDSVRGMLSQTYDPLEIVISDDCSTDRTWDIVLKEVESYRKAGGVHKIVLNRNEKNLGIALHYSKVITLRHGDLIVGNGGDDISTPDRVEKIVKAWLKSNKKVTRIQHQGICVDVNGQEIGPVTGYDKWQPLGAMTAYSRRVFDEFPRIELASVYEDMVYGYRSLMIGDYLELPDELVRYRIGSGVSTQLRNWRKHKVNVCHAICESCKVLYDDMQRIREEMPSDRFEEINANIHHKDYLSRNRKLLYAGDTFKERLCAFKIVHVSAIPWHISMFAFFLVQCACLVPCRVTDFFIDSVMRIKLKVKIIKWRLKNKRLSN